MGLAAPAGGDWDYIEFDVSGWGVAHSPCCFCAARQLLYYLPNCCGHCVNFSSALWRRPSASGMSLDGHC